MSNIFDIWLKRFQNLNLEKIFYESVKETLSELEDLQTDQLSLGLKSTGELITPELRSDTYAKIKKSKGGKAPPGTPDLKDEGDFYSSIMAKLESNFINIFSTDNKAKDLEKNYSNDIYKLTDENQTKYNIEILLPVFRENIERKLWQ